jgi:cysteine-rich repeat protein
MKGLRLMGMTHSDQSTRSRRRGAAVARTVLAVAAAVACAQHAGAQVPGPIGGGLISRLAIDPHTPTTLYAGTDCGGLLKSIDGGANWLAVNASLPGTIVSTLAIDPITPGTVYAGIQNADGNPFGVFKTTNGGRAWQAVNAGLSLRPRSDSQPVLIQVLAIDPVVPSTLYAGARGGAFKSTDGAASWHAIDAGLPSFPVVTVLAVDPSTPSTLYAAENLTGGLFESSDGGGAWSASGLESAFVTALAIDPLTPGTLYAAGPYGVAKSTDGFSMDYDFANSGLTYTDIDALAIDPRTPTTLYAAERYSGGVFKSTDGAATWGPANVDLPDTVLALAIDPFAPDTLYAATAEGLFKSTDGASTWNPTGLRNVLCGDGLRCGGAEECDDGNAVDGDGCDTNCTVTRCGNGVATAGEECDDGNGDPSDGCTTACTICGNGTVTAPEQCDDGNRDNNDACTNACMRNVCNDGFLNPATEQCDDGNLVDGDGCDSNCSLTACGNGVVTSGEECDDGNRVDGDGCDSNCTVSRCGNGVVSAGEECDDGNRNPFDGCTTHCTICGDGIVTPPEECDDGNTNPSDGCTNACTRCGNGVITEPETCDDGNLANGDGCDADCQTVCGNGVVGGNEECDDGGTCIGGAQAGSDCTADTDCPGGHCQPFGGDGCAANCTLESDVPFNLLPGVLQSQQVEPGTSGANVAGAFTIPLPLSGSQTLTIGKARNGRIPLVIKAAAVHVDRVQLPYGNGCFCPRAVAAKTCGGTVFEPDGVTPSLDCTAGFTAGESVCEGKNPCTFVHGSGNSASGVIGCDGLDDVNVSFTQDAGGSSGTASPPRLTLSGSGGSGAALLSASTAIGGGFCVLGQGSGSKLRRDLEMDDRMDVGDSPLPRSGGGCLFLCTGEDVSVYGPDGEFCTDDDPPEHRGIPVTAPVTTGTATGRLLNADQSDGFDLGPLTVTGARFRCADLQGAPGDASGAVLASAFTELQHRSLGDGLVTSVLVANACVGDCDRGGAVSVSEIVMLVNIVLGAAPPSACARGLTIDGNVDVAVLIQAVNNALNGCPAPPTITLTPSITPTPTITLTPSITRTPTITPTPTSTNTGTPPTSTATLGPADTPTPGR